MMFEEPPNKPLIDKALKRQGGEILRALKYDCVNVSDGTYYLCALTQDCMKMLHSIINRNMSKQEAKAVFKVALDDVLLNYGMSVAIHEFNN